MAFEFDLERLPEGFYDDPYPWYRRLQSEYPVYRCPARVGADRRSTTQWFISRYDDVMSVYRDSKRFSSDKRVEFAPVFGNGPLFTHHTTSLVFNDPPLHTRVRRTIAGALKPSIVSALEADVIKLVDALLERMQHRQHVDLVADFAACIPVEVIGNLLRIPHDEREPLRDWSLAILGALEASVDPAAIDAGNAAVAAFCDYLEHLIRTRRAQLSVDDDDILARLLQAQPGDQGLTDVELVHNCIFILNAGHETTTNLIANGVHCLLRHPDSMNALRADPTLMPSAVEEFLRFESPNQLGNRKATTDVRIGDTTIKAGDYLWLGIGAANRDPAQFERPDVFDITRSPNPHLAFAAGIHTCAGLNVARLEARIAIGRLLQRFDDIAIHGEVVRSRRARFRGFDAFPVTVR